MELKAFEKWYAREVGDIGDCDPEEIKFFAKSAYFAGLNTLSTSADKLIDTSAVLATHLRKGGYTGTMFQDFLKAITELQKEQEI